MQLIPGPLFSQQGGQVYRPDCFPFYIIVNGTHPLIKVMREEVQSSADIYHSRRRSFICRSHESKIRYWLPQLAIIVITPLLELQLQVIMLLNEKPGNLLTFLFFLTSLGDTLISSSWLARELAQVVSYRPCLRFAGAAQLETKM